MKTKAKRRAPGTGTIEQLPSGRYRIRIPAPDGMRRAPSAETFATHEEAEAILDAAVAALWSGEVVCVSQETLAGFGEKHLEELKRLGAGGMSSLKSRFNAHIKKAPFANKAMRQISRDEVEAWVKNLRGKVSPNSARPIVSLLRTMLGAAKIDLNPASGVRVKRAAGTHDPWTFLTLAEQARLFDLMPEPERWIFETICGALLRPGEAWALRLADTHADDEAPHVVVRYGTPYGPPKGRRIRRVELFGRALAGMRAWLPQLERYAPSNPHELTFPTKRGKFRRTDDSPPGWAEWCEAAKLGRRVRVHDLRHTGATSLLGGWWGRKWSLEEIKQLMGHSSITQTEKYAHVIPTGLIQASAETAGPATPQKTSENRVGLVVAHAKPTEEESSMITEGYDGDRRKACSKGFSRITGAGPSLVGLAWARRGLRDEAAALADRVSRGEATADDMRALAVRVLSSPVVHGALRLLEADDEHLAAELATWLERLNNEVDQLPGAAAYRTKRGVR